MELAQKMFLLAAEEMNFTKAAKRAFVTQQCLSEHISKLEKQLHTKLFLRGRHLELTESGKAMVSTLRQIQHLEENLGHRIQEIEAGEIGEIRLGISTSRARLLLPRFLETFHETYPQVHISITLGDTVQHIQLMKTQQLDLVVGLDAPADPFLEEELIAKGNCNLKGIRLFWNMVDRRGRKNLYDAWNRVIHRMGLRLLSSHIPNTLRYNKEADPVCKGVFRSTLFPPDPRQEKDSGLPELVEEICHAIGLEESDTER